MPDSQVAIIDYGMGNLFSVQRACEYVGLSTRITRSSDEILKAYATILPGVGAFGDAMSNLKKMDLVSPLKDFIKSGKPFLGICLGMQLLMDESEEFGRHKGLGIFAGQVVRFVSLDSKRKIKVPQVGWNRVCKRNARNIWNNSLLEGIADREYMYFVHSFYSVPVSEEVILSVSSYEGIEYCSALSAGNIFASQFHPEKSASAGLLIYENFARLINNRRNNINDVS